MRGREGGDERSVRRGRGRRGKAGEGGGWDKISEPVLTGLAPATPFHYWAPATAGRACRPAPSPLKWRGLADLNSLLSCWLDCPVILRIASCLIERSLHNIKCN
jgi:hypothetical protein